MFRLILTLIFTLTALIAVSAQTSLAVTAEKASEEIAGETIHIEVPVEVQDFYHALGEQVVPLGIGVLLYVLVLSAVRRSASGLRKRAEKIRSEVDRTEETRLSESEQALGVSDDERAEMMAKDRKKQLALEADAEREAHALEDRAEHIWSRGLWYSTFGMVAWVVFVIAVFVGFDPVFELLTLLTPQKLSGLFTLLLKIFLILFGINVGRMIIRGLTAKIMHAVEDDDPDTMTEAELRTQTLVNVIRGTATVILWVIGLFMILNMLSVPIAPLLTGAGIIGLAIGFGAQSLVRDFISGFFILMENQFRVGDVVKTAGVGGLVERITLRTTTLRDIAGSVHVIPNGEITQVTNMTYKWSRNVSMIGVAYASDPDTVIALLDKVGKKMHTEEPWNQKMLDDPEVLGLDEMADSAIYFKVLLKTKPLQQWAVGREFNRRVFYALREAGIEIPFPHRTVYHRMEEGDTINVLSAKPVEEEAPKGMRRYLGAKHIPPVVPEESGGGPGGETV